MFVSEESRTIASLIVRFPRDIPLIPVQKVVTSGLLSGLTQKGNLVDPRKQMHVVGDMR